MARGSGSGIMGGVNGNHTTGVETGGRGFHAGVPTMAVAALNLSQDGQSLHGLVMAGAVMTAGESGMASATAS